MAVGAPRDMTSSSSWRPPRSDVILAVVLVAIIVGGFAVAEATNARGREVTALSYVFGAAAGLLVMFRRVQPVLTLVATATTVLVYVLSAGEGGPIGLALWVALYSVAAEGNRKRSVIAAGCSAVIVSIIVYLTGSNDPSLLEQVAAVGLTIVPLLIGDLVHARRRLIAETDERVRLVEAAAEQQAERRVQDERVRIARELHDVVAHSIATINVQAGVAAHVIDAEPGAAKDALTDIKESSRLAMAEMRAMLGVLRAPDDVDEGGPLAPSPNVDGVADLVARFAGEAVFTAEGVPEQPVDPAIGLVVYRVVQEGLTNALKHVVGARVRVVVEYRADDISVLVADDGGTGRADGVDGTGLGLVGLSERVRSVGGSIAATPRFDGGFEIAASVPYVPREAAPSETAGART